MNLNSCWIMDLAPSWRRVAVVMSQWNPVLTACAIYIERTFFTINHQFPQIQQTAICLLVSAHSACPYHFGEARPPPCPPAPRDITTSRGEYEWLNARLGFQWCAPLHGDICFSSVQRRSRRSRALTPLQHQYRGSICCHDIRATEREEPELN